MKDTTDMTSAFKNLKEYIYMWKGILFDECFGCLSNLARDRKLWEPIPVTVYLIKQLNYGKEAGEGGYMLHADD